MCSHARCVRVCMCMCVCEEERVVNRHHATVTVCRDRCNLQERSGGIMGFARARAHSLDHDGDGRFVVLYASTFLGVSHVVPWRTSRRCSPGWLCVRLSVARDRAYHCATVVRFSRDPRGTRSLLAREKTKCPARRGLSSHNHREPAV